MNPSDTWTTVTGSRNGGESLTSRTASPEAIAEWNAELRDQTPLEIVRWSIARANGRAVVSTNFRPYEAVILHLCTQVEPEIPVLWVDHGYNRQATYHHAEQLRKVLRLNIKAYL